MTALLVMPAERMPNHCVICTQGQGEERDRGSEREIKRERIWVLKCALSMQWMLIQASELYNFPNHARMMKEERKRKNKEREKRKKKCKGVTGENKISECPCMRREDQPVYQPVWGLKKGNR